MVFKRLERAGGDSEKAHVDFLHIRNARKTHASSDSHSARRLDTRRARLILDHVLLLSPVFSPPSVLGYPVYYSVMGFKHAAVLAPVCFFLGALLFEVILPGT